MKLTRREALAKLGLTAGTIYTASTILRIDRSARAQAPSQGNQPGCPPEQSKKGLC